MRTLLYQWIRGNSLILFNAGSLVGATAVTSLLGFAYWWLAARRFSPEAVGLGAALVSAMLLLGNLCILGLGTLLIGELPRHRGREASLITGALILVGGVGGCIGTLFAIVAPYVSINFQPMKGGLGDIALFAAGVSFTAITLVLDQALLGLLRGGLQLWRNTLFAVAKLITLFVAALWFSYVAGMTIYATWAIGNALSLVVLAGFTVWKRGWSGRAYLPQWGLLCRLRFAALQHHLLNLALQAPSLALPVLVTTLLSPTANAWFYVSWMIAGFVFVLQLALTIALYAASSAQPVMLAHRIRMTLTLALVSCVLANCILQLGAKQVLEFFGHAYAQQAEWSLRILGIAAFPLIVKDHYIAVCRIRKKIVYAMTLVIAGVILELSLAALGGRLFGLTGVSLGWVIAVSAGAFFMFRTVYKAARSVDISTDGDQLQRYELDYNDPRIVEPPANEPSFGQ